MDEKDRMGEKFREVEAAREDQWARQRDAELLEKMRKKAETAKVPCPRCGKTLSAEVATGMLMLVCPKHHGAWLDQAGLEKVLTLLK